jgi:hypothetical protein
MSQQERWMALPMGLLVLMGAVTATVGPCSLNGEVSTGGACSCDPGWRGPSCAQLDVAPSRVLWPQLSDGDPRTFDAPSLSWGGSLLRDNTTGLWHGWFNAGCQTATSFMHTYLTGAVHAVADTVEGPYRFVDVSVPGELENPMAVSDGKGGVLIVYLDHTYPNGSSANLPMPCFGASNGTLVGSTPRPETAGPFARPICATLQPSSHSRDPKIEGRRLGIAAAPSPSGPWSYTFPNISKPDYVESEDSDIECGINPSPFRLTNGTWLLATRYEAKQGSHLTLAVADEWGGPYTVVSSGAQWQAGVATGGSEDPVVWRNNRGYLLDLRWPTGY